MSSADAETVWIFGREYQLLCVPHRRPQRRHRYNEINDDWDIAKFDLVSTYLLPNVCMQSRDALIVSNMD